MMRKIFSEKRNHAIMVLDGLMAVSTGIYFYASYDRRGGSIEELLNQSAQEAIQSTATAKPVASNASPNPSATPASEPTRSAALGRSYERIVETGTVHVSLLDRSKPFFFFENKEPKGFNYDFMRILFAQIDLCTTP